MKFQIEISSVGNPIPAGTRGGANAYKWDLQVIDPSSALDRDGFSYDGSYSESGTAASRNQASQNAKRAAAKFLQTLAENNNTEVFLHSNRNMDYEITITSGVGNTSEDFKDNFKWNVRRTDRKAPQEYNFNNGSIEYLEVDGYSRSKVIAREEAMQVIQAWTSNPADCDVYTLDVSDLWELS